MQSEKLIVPSITTLLKISLGLIVVAILTSAFVYAETVSVSIDGTSYDIMYSGNGVSITGVESDLDFISLILSVDVTESPAILNITFDRIFFDSKFQDSDDEFFVLLDGEPIEIVETQTTSQTRTLNIELSSGTEEIEIIGSVFGSPIEEPPVEKPVITEPPVEKPSYKAPVEKPPVESPDTVETPTTQPSTPPPKETMQKTECGPGTILKDGVCVLDQRCGPGTILKDGTCVLEPKPTPTRDVRGMGIELIIGFVAAFVIAGAVGILLALMSKASKNKN